LAVDFFRVFHVSRIVAEATKITAIAAKTIHNGVSLVVGFEVNTIDI